MTPTTSRRCSLIIAFALLGPTAGCTSSPVPQPLPFYMRKSTPSPQRLTTLVVGLPLAVAGAGKVHVRDGASAAQATGPSSVAGSFVVLLASSAATVEVRFENPDGLSDPVTLAPLVSFGPQLTGSRGPGVVSAPDASNLVTVSNDGGAGQPLLLQATPQTDALLSNTATAEVVTTRVLQDGRFTARLRGARGDEISILLADDSRSTSDYLSFTVP